MGGSHKRGSTRRPTQAGGAAAAGGMDFQHRVAAWFCVRILAEENCSSPLDLPTDTTLVSLSCETGNPIDDILVRTSASGYLFVQAKTKLSLSGQPGSELASVAGQIVTQFLAFQDPDPADPTTRPLDPHTDRLVIATTSRSPSALQTGLANSLRRLRRLPKGSSINDAVVNSDERRALGILVGQLKHFWQLSLGSTMPDGDLDSILRLLHLLVLDVTEGGTHEREARDLLRSGALADASEDKSVWAWLVTEAQTLAATRASVDRPGLARMLQESGFRLRAPRSYADDIERLGRYSRGTASQLQHLARIRVGNVQVKIERGSTRALLEAAAAGSVVVVGEPGAGKSGALYDVAERLAQSGRAVVLLAADHVSARSLSALRSELGLENDLADILANWPLKEPGLLIIDALDAARGGSAAALRALIRVGTNSGGRWRVIASIRRFDLRYSAELRELFQGTSSAAAGFRDPEFADVAHLSIPLLSDAELAQAGSQAEALRELLLAAPAELEGLLRVPFNLRMLAQLINTGASTGELSPIRTQLQLLDRYWSSRVAREGDGLRDAREGILRAVVEAMVKVGALQIARSRLTLDATSSGVLEDLLSSQVLVEWQEAPAARPEGSILAFQHHVFFDYAAERLLLRGDLSLLSQRLAEDGDALLLLHPSLVLHFRHLWEKDASREIFWRAAISLVRHASVREIGKLVGPSVAAELAGTVSDIEPLSKALADSDGAVHTAAEGAAMHVIGALHAAHPGGRPLTGTTAGPWCELAERMSRELLRVSPYPVRSLLFLLTQDTAALTDSQRSACGVAARALLRHAWKAAPRDVSLVTAGLQGVCRTFESNPEESRELLRTTFRVDHLSSHGFEEMPCLAREIDRLILVAPEFASEVYRAAFGFREGSEAPTQIGHSQILSMTSNRRQDYQGALYQLGSHFPAFLTAAPSHATRALITSLDGYRSFEASPASAEVSTFTFRGVTAGIRPDHSAVWDAPGTSPHNDVERMLNHFAKALRSPESLFNTPGLHAILDVIATEGRAAALWRSLLTSAAAVPETLGAEVKELAWSTPLLISDDTTNPAGDFLRSVFPILTPAERTLVEDTIMGIPNKAGAEAGRRAVRTRNRLLGCLTPSLIVTDSVRELVADLASKDSIPANTPAFKFTSFKQVSGGDDFLASLGVDVEAEASRWLRDLEAPVRQFADRHLNSPPNEAAVEEALPAIRSLQQGIAVADGRGIHPAQKAYAFTALVSACVRVARSPALVCVEAAGALCRSVFLDGSVHPQPEFRAEMDSHFDDFAHWSPSPRIEAAEGLTFIATSPTCAVPDVLEAIERLSADPVPAVRFQVAAHLTCLYLTAAPVMWRILERLCLEEERLEVLRAAVVGPLATLGPGYPSRIGSLVSTILERTRTRPEEARVAEACVGILFGLHVWHGEELSGRVLATIVRDVASDVGRASHIPRFIREPISYAASGHDDARTDLARQRTLELVYELVTVAIYALNAALEPDFRPGGSETERSKRHAQELARLVDHIGTELYFASGAYQAPGESAAAGAEPLPIKRRILQDISPILEKLGGVGLMPSLTHHIVETLETLIPADPRGVFLFVTRLVKSSTAGGYQHESQGVAAFVRIVCRYLADYRPLLQDDKECRVALLESLDTFVRVGWPEARRLTYRVGNIYR